MNESNKKITVIAFKRLLVELKEHRPDICVRCRLMGQMWSTNFSRVIQVTERGALLNDEISDKIITLHDLSNVMQFEIDKAFQAYQPYFHYDVVTTGEW